MRTRAALVIVALGLLPFRIDAQSPDVRKILSEAREALGGDKKLATVKSLTATGKTSRVTPNGSVANDFELALELPDKFLKKDVVAMINGSAITRTSGFNGANVIEAVDTPPQMGGGIFIMRGAGGGPSPLGAAMTPEQQEAVKKSALAANKQEFVRLTLGIFASSFDAYPLQFSYAGQAESPDGKADVIDVKGEGEFAAKLFVDAQTHLPLMLSWMAKEPLAINIGGRLQGPGGGMTMTAGGGRGETVVRQMGPPPGGGQMTPEEREKFQRDAMEAMKEAQAKARVVEYRVYYGDYQKVDGVNVPFKIQRSIDGKPSEETTIEKVKVNPKIDAKKFDVK